MGSTLLRTGLDLTVAGIAYQLTPHDPLVDTAQCKRDIARMSELGTNAIRVYHVDPSADHKGCMSAFADAGIYLFVDLDTFTTQIEQVRDLYILICDFYTTLESVTHTIIDGAPLEPNSV